MSQELIDNLEQQIANQACIIKNLEVQIGIYKGMIETYEKYAAANDAIVKTVEASRPFLFKKHR